MKHDVGSSLTIDDWVEVTKSFGPSEFKRVGVEFLREYYGRQVLYTDGKGDGGVDAWVVLQSEPEVRRAGQFHAGKSETWDNKLEDDIKAFCKYRDKLTSNDPAHADFKRMSFVTNQVTDKTFAEERTQEILESYGVNVRVFDAREITGLALQNKSGLWALLATHLPGYDATAKPPQTMLERTLLAFSFFHDKPRNYRWAVVKSAIATVLHNHGGAVEQDKLVAESQSTLKLSSPTLVHRTIRNLQSEDLIEIRGEIIHARETLTDSIRASLALSAIEQKALRGRCVTVLEPLVPEGKHHKHQIAERAVDAIFNDLGLLIRYPIREQVLYSVEPSKQPRSRYERETFKRWKNAVSVIEEELGAGTEGHEALESVVEEVAQSSFAKSLAAAELFLRLTEYDAQEFEQALSADSSCVLLDTNVALPMLCALFDAPVTSWPTSTAAYQLYQTLKTHDISCVIPSVYLEEMAVHLLNARDFAELIESDADLERSHNYFVAHYCSLNAEKRSRNDFLKFLGDFGARNVTGTRDIQRLAIMNELRDQILPVYGIRVETISEQPTDPQLVNEPPKRDILLLRHDRAVVRMLQEWVKREPRWLVCSADGWLRAALNERNIVAMDSVGLTDLLELIRPTGLSRPLLSPLELASSIGEHERELAAAIWDEIVRIEGAALRDRDLLNQAREFRNEWVAKPRDEEISVAWIHFREKFGKRDMS